jgi:formylglycine-generating enzyme required for sulfatase activity
MGANPSHFKGPQKPVEQVSWEDSVKFANALSRKLGLTPAYSGDDNNARVVEEANGFRLPLEAEWAFAARGGESFEFAGSDHLDKVGWYRDNSGSSTHDVAQLKPNAYGLYDMSGNVWEWCSDDYKNSGQHRPGVAQRVKRGGCWDDGAVVCAVTFRISNTPDFRVDDLGLRLSRSVR